MEVPIIHDKDDRSSSQAMVCTEYYDTDPEASGKSGVNIDGATDT